MQRNDGTAGSGSPVDAAGGPTRPVVIPRDAYWRVQIARGVIASVGAVMTGVGAGLSLSHGGQIGTSWEAALGWPSLIAIALALLALYAPLAPRLRWVLFGATALVLFLLRVDVGPEWPFVFALVGIALSWMLAHVLRAVFDWAVLARRRASGVVLATLASAVVLAAVFDPETAVAQDVAACPAGEVSLIIDGTTYSFSAGGEVTDVIEVELERDVEVFDVGARADFEQGTVRVVLHEATPFVRPAWPFVPARWKERPVVWTGEITPDGDGRGRTETAPVTIARTGELSTFEVEVDAHRHPVRLVAGEGLYRATFSNAETGEECILDARIRLIASPLTTWGGLAALLTAVGGFGIAGGAVVAGEYTPRSVRRASSRPPRGLPRGRWSSPPAGPPAHVDPPAVGDLGLDHPPFEGGPAAIEDGPVFELMLRVDVDVKDDVDVLTVDSSARGLFRLVEFKPVLLFTQGGETTIPVRVTKDPDAVNLDAALEIEVSLDGIEIASGTAAFNGDVFELVGGGAEVDLRDHIDLTVDDGAGAAPLETAERSRE